MKRIDKIKKIKIKFTHWKKWNEREDLFKDKRFPAMYPGVYLLAHFRIVPKKVNPISKRIRYIGETCKTLRGRLNQFNRSAFEGKEGHGGGKTYKKEFKNKMKNYLYFSLFPVKEYKKYKEKEIGDSFIRYIERKLIWDYVSIWHNTPTCNKE